MSSELQPVELVRDRPHEFTPPVNPATGRRAGGSRVKCEHCGRTASWIEHHAYPESFNVGGSGYNIFAYQNQKKMWQAWFVSALAALELPRPLARVVVEGELTFPRRPGRSGPDQENFRYPLSKFLGDALEEGGWLEQDNWPSFEFGGLGYRHEAGVQRMRLILFPTPIASELAA